LSDDVVHREVTATKGRYVIVRPEGEAELTYSILTPTQVIADHTAVPAGLEGQGLGRKLLDALLADARREGFRIMPLCPYVNAQRKKHPEWAELFSV
jgi:predicted GNAT family acetyltransferase